ncbi:hypothetical protein ACH47B_13265 [Rhodococcus sp. NPDC019627]|uniref:hypothetical protein n=1 Tax=unclassified Rhodococcus (in: high G+C Gram-positive bacteria) TaxID=192944 RepID=UPI0033C7B3E2
MGMYTEVFMRMHLKKDAPEALVDWFDNLANGDGDWEPYDDHPYFTVGGGWDRIFCSGGAVYQISRRVQFTRMNLLSGQYYHELVVLTTDVGDGVAR